MIRPCTAEVFSRLPPLHTHKRRVGSSITYDTRYTETETNTSTIVKKRITQSLRTGGGWWSTKFCREHERPEDLETHMNKRAHTDLNTATNTLVCTSREKRYGLCVVNDTSRRRIFLAWLKIHLRTAIICWARYVSFGSRLNFLSSLQIARPVSTPTIDFGGVSCTMWHATSTYVGCGQVTAVG